MDLILCDLAFFVFSQWAAGAKPSEVMIAHVVTQLVMLSIQVSLLLLVAVLVFSIPCHGSIASILGLTLLLGMAGMLYGLFLSSICADEQECVQYSTGSFFPVMLLSGILWPVEGIPGVLRYLAKSLPTTWAATALRDLMARGWGWENESVWQAFLVVFGTLNRLINCEKYFTNSRTVLEQVCLPVQAGACSSCCCPHVVCAAVIEKGQAFLLPFLDLYFFQWCKILCVR